ncbi:Zinc finger protein 862 [Dissostichus eleginoides]|uniref:Zinc finger protein 862 n=1 Tax=Dissostichus eleginoides TaxID=100907 RepID=A0AAD9F2W8_DISEL|nr:Zinc finger protein 862 [Dissostichus eleginoides]
MGQRYDWKRKWGRGAFKKEKPSHRWLTHKLNLCAQQAAAAIPSLQHYQRTVGSIYGYFSNSSSLQARLKEMHVILDTDDVKLKSIHAVRWLSFGEAHVALHRTMHAVAEVFQQDAELMHDTMAETLAKAMLTYEFIGINSLLCDILGTIACLSKAFQLKPLYSTINALRAMQIGEEGGPKFQEFLANIAENNGETYFKGEKIKATRVMRQAVDGVRQRFLDTLIQNIEDRFPDIGLFSAFRIFDPRCLPQDNTEHARFGRDEHPGSLVPSGTGTYR